jgi:hypothetical protein
MYLCLILCVWCTCALCNIPICKSNASFLLLSRFLCLHKSSIVLILCFCDYYVFVVLLEKNQFQASSIAVKVLLVSWFFSCFKALLLLWFCSIHCALVYYIVCFCGFTVLLCNFYLDYSVHLLWTSMCMNFLFQDTSLLIAPKFQIQIFLHLSQP